MTYTSRTHYDVLGIAPTATDQEIKAAYRRLAKTVHPDHGSGNSALFDLITEAYRTLSKPGGRARYDRELADGATAQGSGATSSSAPREDPSMAHKRGEWSFKSAFRTVRTKMASGGPAPSSTAGRGRESAATQSPAPRATGWRRLAQPLDELPTRWRVALLLLVFTLTVLACSLSGAHFAVTLGLVPKETVAGYDAHGNQVVANLIEGPPGSASVCIVGFLACFALAHVLRIALLGDDPMIRGLIAGGQLLLFLFVNYTVGFIIKGQVEYLNEHPGGYFWVRHPALTAWPSGLASGLVAAATLWWTMWRLARDRRAQALQDWTRREAANRFRAARAGYPRSGARTTSTEPAVGEIWWADVPFAESADSKDRPVLVLSTSATYAEAMMFTSQDQSGRTNYHEAPGWLWQDGKASFLKLDRVIQLHRSALRRREGKADTRTMAAARAASSHAKR